jgi:2,3-bisphosphoglycerate-independent phosphoglycerate mutase
MQGRSLFEKKLPVNSERRVMLVILDGWGFNPDDFGNLVKEADTPNYDWWMQNCPNSLLRAAGESVGLPENTVGNSEVGHLHLGSGRIVPSDKVRIKKDMEDGSFNRNPAFLKVMRKAKEAGTALHLLGIISFFSSHGSIDYALALLRMAKEVGVKKVYVHGLLGRRGERPESGAYYTKKIEDEAERLGVGEVVSVIGRHWALDREYNWDRIEKTYRMLVYGDGVKV